MPIRLYRSRIEITRFLRALADERAMLWTMVGEASQLVFTRLMHVDPRDEWIAVAFAGSPGDNRRLIEAASLTLRATYRGDLVQFVGDDPAEAEHGGTFVIRLRFPHALLTHPYHRLARLRAPAPVPLRCIADAAGYLPFEAEIVDLSDAGVGMLECDAGIRLPESSVLRGSRIFHPGGAELRADMEIYGTRLVGDGGLRVQRAVFRLVRRPHNLERFSSLFACALDRAACA